MKSTKRYILEQLKSNQLVQKDAMKMLKEIAEGTANEASEIAVIGTACNLSNADNPKEFWDNLIAEQECLNLMPKELMDYYKPYENPHYAEFLGITPLNVAEERLKTRGSYINDLSKFDAKFFNISPREATYIDPIQRVYLQTMWSALEDSGYGGEEIYGSNVGVFVGKDHNNSTLYKNITEANPLSTVGAWNGMIASRLSYLFDLHGPTMVLDTACSSGLVAIHEACNSLRNGDCEMAIAGGISAGGAPLGGGDDEGSENDALTSVVSSDQTVRSFDKKSSGTVFGEGSVCFILKPVKKALRDGDHIYSIIKGSALNNDGASNSITAPNPLAQEEVIIEAWKKAGIEPETISYVETHGTGTLLGDPVEIKALNNSFQRFTNKKQFCGIGSVKTNIGHVVAASGCASMLKVMLSMENEVIPPSLNFEEPNPHISFCDSALYVVDKPTEWHKEQQARRAGISSFGFTGTNVHLILEEPPVRKQSGENKEKERIFTLSAKNKNSLTLLVRKYQHLLSNKSNINLDELCYTANTGRGHYKYRLALLFKNKEELDQQLAELLKIELGKEKLPKIYFGDSSTVGQKFEFETDNIDSIEELSIKLNEHSEKLACNCDTERSQLLQDFSGYYTSGKKVNWQLFYGVEKYQKVSLPTYPFEKTTFWADVKESKLKNTEIKLEKQVAHPLVDGCITESLDQDIFSVRLSVDNHWVLEEHVITGKNIVPGTAYIEMAREVLSNYIDGPIEFHDIIFKTPLVVTEDEETDTQVIINKSKEKFTFKIASKKVVNGYSEWTVHAEGKANQLNEVAGEGLEIIKLQDDSRYPKRKVKLPKLGTEGAIMTFGPRWQNVEFVSVAEEGMYVHAKLPEVFLKDLEHFKYHTSMLDATVNAGIQATLQGVYLPFAFKNFKMYHNLPKEVYSYTTKKSKEGYNQETLTYDIILTDKEGNLLAEINDYTVKKVKKMNEYVANDFFELEWLTSEVEKNEIRNLEGNILFFKDNGNFSKALMSNIETPEMVVTVSIGEAYCKVSNREYIIGSSQEDYDRLLLELDGFVIDKIIHGATMDLSQQTHQLNEFDFANNQGVFSLFFLTKALVKKKVEKAVDFILLTDHAEQVTGNERMIKPLNSAYLSLGKSIHPEYAKLNIRSIDIDDKTDVSLIMSEILDENGDFRTAYREGKRYTECLSKTSNTKAGKNIQIREGSVVITGGTGGLGLEVAEHFAKRSVKDIFLISRKKIPNRKLWPKFLEDGKDPKQCAIIQKIQEIEKNEASVHLYSVDVCNHEEMEQTMNKISKLGRISGILHCAGNAGDGFMMNKEFDEFKKVYLPKTNGTQIIEELTSTMDLDFFILFSSMTTFFGGPGQSDYTAANAFLDSFAQMRNLQSKDTMTINWPAWSEVGMAVDYAVTEFQSLFKPISTANALSVLDEVLEEGISNIIPSEINIDVLSERIETLPVSLSKDLEISVKRHLTKQSKAEAKEVKVQMRGNCQLIGKEEYTRTEAVVGNIYAGVLELEEINVYESFNSMGGDSMLTTEVLNILNQQFDDVLDISDMFSYQTVVEMSEFIDNTIEVDEIKEDTIIQDVSDIMTQFETGDIELEEAMAYFS